MMTGSGQQVGGSGWVMVVGGGILVFSFGFDQAEQNA